MCPKLWPNKTGIVLAVSGITTSDLFTVNARGSSLSARPIRLFRDGLYFLRFYCF
jgi:hypothetical protein